MKNQNVEPETTELGFVVSLDSLDEKSHLPSRQVSPLKIRLLRLLLLFPKVLLEIPYYFYLKNEVKKGLLKKVEENGETKYCLTEKAIRLEIDAFDRETERKL